MLKDVPYREGKSCDFVLFKINLANYRRKGKNVLHHWHGRQCFQTTKWMLHSNKKWKRWERLHFFNNLVTCLVFQSSIWWLIGENEANGTKHLMLSHSSIRWLTSKSSNGKCHTFLSWSIDLHFIKTKIYSQKIMLNIISYWFKM